MVRGNSQRLQQVVINLVLNACQAIQDEQTEIRVCTRFDPGARAVDLHGGDAETSPMLVCAPHKVDMAKARNFRPAMLDWGRTWIGLTGQAARPGWIIDDLNAEGACGDASAATAEKGEALLASAARNFAAFLVELSAFDHRAGHGAENGADNGAADGSRDG